MLDEGAAGAGTEDTAAVARLLGRPPLAGFEVVLRSGDGEPVVIRNDPFTHSGRPMPTRWWLVGPQLVSAVSRLEAGGGVSRASAEVDEASLRRAHLDYAAERDAAIPAGWTGARPSGGVGGTREGVKCLHAHLAWWLVGGDDPVGEWVSEQIAGSGLLAGLRG